MWSDNETVRDLVNFSHVAEIAAERIVEARGEPRSIGISGDWGVGKSSMMKLLHVSLQGRTDLNVRVVEFNAWPRRREEDYGVARAHALAQNVAPLAEEFLSHHDAFVGSVTLSGKAVKPHVAAL